MDYFKLNEIQNYAASIGKKYESESNAASWYLDTRAKLEHLVKLLGEATGFPLLPSYHERPNKQAGQGKGLVLRDYVLLGFTFANVKAGEHVFIKLIFHRFENAKCFFAIEVDIDFKNNKDQYTQYLGGGKHIKKDRDQIQQDTYWETPVDETFPKDWETLVDLILPKVKEEVEYLQTIRKVLPDHVSFEKENPKQNMIPSKSTYSHPLNQILYGPPGTGKTFHTINHALAIIENKTIEEIGKEKREDLIERFKNYRNLKQIEFTTFHQSMSYEDFVEGIKPQEPTAEQLQVTYKVEPGIFKLICEKAKLVQELKKQDASIFNGSRFYKMSLGGLNRSDIYEWCLENNCLALGWGNDVNFESYKGILDWATYRDKFIAENPGLVKESRFNITAMYTFQNMRAGDIVAISKGNRIIDAIGRVEGEYYWGDNSPFGYFQFRKIEWLAKNINQNPELFFNKKITQQSIYQFYDIDVKKESFIQFFTKNTDESKLKPHVLIIDEINRGNVSQIFGELITLLEEDKRMGNKEGLEVTLPYSKETFSVPSNLYIIGTMNTADRSVEALDTALRRRFSFIEMPPDKDLLSPSAVFWRLMKKYGAVPWDDDEYQKKETLLFDLLGADDFVKNNKYSFWEKFVKDKKEELFSKEHFKGYYHLDILLEKINCRIEKLLDKDHLIGHSYFMNVYSMDDLKNTFYRNIIPLLQEYFFGDYGKIGLVLGAGFVEMDKSEGDFADFSGYEDIAELDERRIYRIKKEGDWKEGEFDTALKLLLKKRI